ncbi:4-hydroxyphenylacetate 3-hydroxylase N-terminal domain-containing protein [Trichlorobacter ammonificans]|uniref:4-hydroxybutyryl-CoA dehydratase/vinylacetyl-CoA-Delta-isomerase n=1 Tax=Trichlorobacter ammonificans TaxID=2916410 RepID=A0ABM9DBD2_9BACT|nr:4-hydroxyphenylacetate 3-hydroxylase N-terminal domain-containing protein [Trichlorobacter ammonificans]CAH2031978.1 4-hydroxybutyryl-CoA dehydratase/vinylacetyl-CoA-Delta-isomerase [Trichlorobacter ammonificans]
MKNGAQYRNSLKKLRPNLFKWGKLLKDVTRNPATKLHVDAIAACYDAAFDPEQRTLFTNQSHLSGKPAHRWNTLMRTPEDILANARMKRAQFHRTGACHGATCAGWTMLNALWAVTWEIDQARGTTYHSRLERYFRFLEDNSLATAGALTDAKGNRSLGPATQPLLDSHLHIKEIREDGVVVRGVKAQICGVAAAHEIVCVPGGSLKEDESSFAIAFAIPRDVAGLTIVETRRPSDTRDEEEGWDAPKVGGISQAFLLFDDVFVPNERIFLNGEHEFAALFINIFTALYRAPIGACVAGQGDVMIGAAIELAQAAGLSQKIFQDRLTRMAINNETTFGLGIGAIFNGSSHPSGLWIPDPLLSHVNKILVATLPYDTKRIAQELGGGIVETGCFPSYRDLHSPLYGKELLDSLAAASDGETRARLARLQEWLTIGGGIPGCLNGGGAPDGARIMVRALEPWKEFAALARVIAGVQ